MSDTQCQSSCDTVNRQMLPGGPTGHKRLTKVVAVCVAASLLYQLAELAPSHSIIRIYDCIIDQVGLVRRPTVALY